MNLKSELINYCEQVLSNDFIYCKKHKWSCYRFLLDLSKEDTEEFPYIFDEDKAEKFLNWMRLFKHRMGVLAGEYIEPHIIQKFIFANIYGWYNRDTGYRRFTKMYWQVGRKNGKSQSLALVGSYELLEYLHSGETSEVYCAATKSEQAKIIYKETVGMLIQCDVLKGKWDEKYGRLINIKTKGEMKPLSEEDKKLGDGFNPQCGLIDEYHAHETSEIYDIIDSGMGARAQPLLCIITTAGFDLNNPCYRIEYDLVSKILNPNIPVNIESYFVMINELDTNNSDQPVTINGRDVAPGDLIDDLQDEKCWEKANPIIYSYSEGREKLNKDAQEAIEAPEKQRNFKTKRLNIWINERERGYMDMAKWSNCKGDLPDLQGKTCYIGFDLSAKIDLTSVSFEFRYADKYVVLSHSFMPADTLEQKRKTDKVPYDLWVKDKWITLTPGAVVDYRQVKEYAISKVKEEGWKVGEICIDPWGAAVINNELIEEGYTVIEIVQGIKTLSEPTKDFREMVYQKRVIHDGNPVLSWAISNAICEEVDRNQNIILNKKKSKQRIDPIASVINAHVRAISAPVVRGGRVFFA